MASSASRSVVKVVAPDHSPGASSSPKCHFTSAGAVKSCRIEVALLPSRVADQNDGLAGAAADLAGPVPNAAGALAGAAGRLARLLGAGRDFVARTLRIA